MLLFKNKSKAIEEIGEQLSMKIITGQILIIKITIFIKKIKKIKKINISIF